MRHFNDSLLAYLNGAIGDKVAAVARGCGIHPDVLYKWLRGDRSPTLRNIGPLLDYLGIRVQFPEAEPDDFEYIPKVSAKAGAGASLETGGEVQSLYPFRRDFLGKNHIYAKNAVLMDVIGDSMEPLFHEGDTLLVDKRDLEVRDGKIYVITLGDELRVKRVLKSVSGLILHSENPRYSDIHVNGQDLDSFVVHGRVRWCGKIV